MAKINGWIPMQNESNTAMTAYYTPNSKGEVKAVGKSGKKRAYHGHRYVSVEDTDKTRIGDTRYTYDENGKRTGTEVGKYQAGREGTHARVVTRNQQYRAIRTALGLTAG